MTCLLGIGGAVLATSRAAQHGSGYHWYCDALVWVGLVSVTLGGYVGLKLFKFPRWWLPEVKSQERIYLDLNTVEVEGLENAAVIRVGNTTRPARRGAETTSRRMR